MRACVLTQKSEEAPASSASLLATPMATRKHKAASYPPCVTITSHGIATLTPPLLLAVGQQLKTPTKCS